MKDQGILIVVSGFSGAGKGTIMKKLVESDGRYALSVSVTTRAPRPGEKEGADYFFKSVGDFERMIAEDMFVEYARYVHNYYGTPKKYVEDNLSAGRDVVLEIEVQGAKKVREQYPEAVLLFVATPSAEVLRQRLMMRNTESVDVVENRIQRAAEESGSMADYDYIIINDDLEKCVKEVEGIIRGEHRKSGRNQEFIRKIQGELKGE